MSENPPPAVDPEMNALLEAIGKKAPTFVLVTPRGLFADAASTRNAHTVFGLLIQAAVAIAAMIGVQLQWIQAQPPPGIIVPGAEAILPRRVRDR